MKRDPLRLTRQEYDLVVIGGGIYGISVARDAALRGLRVAMLDQGDFGNATSSNHHKIIHGGLRYLQHCDLKRMRESIRERSILLRIAPHLVHPLSFLIPTYKHCVQGKLLLSLALKLNDLISLDRNRNLESHKQIPSGRVISKTECLGLCPDLDHRDLTGAAIYFDAQVYNPDRLNLALLLSAVKLGAEVINYARVTAFLQYKNRVIGVEAKDVLSDHSFPVRGRLVMNCAGPWINRVLHSLLASARPKRVHLSKALVLITRPLVRSIAIGVPTPFRYTDKDWMIKKGFRYVFITPWRNVTLIGTSEIPYAGDPDALEVTEIEICNFISEINAAFPAAAIKREDVYGVLRGLLPSAETDGHSEDIQMNKHYEIRDHATENGIQGLVSVLGVKYTTARSVAEKAVNLGFEKLGKKPARCRTAEIPVDGGAISCFEDFLTLASKTRPVRIPGESLQHLAATYGSEYQKLLCYCESDPNWAQPVTSDSPIIKAEILHGVRAEMAQKLSDVIFRRTEFGTAGYPGEGGLYACAEIMAKELGWSRKTISHEIEEVQSRFCRTSA